MSDTVIDVSGQIIKEQAETISSVRAYAEKLSSDDSVPVLQIVGNSLLAILDRR